MRRKIAVVGPTYPFRGGIAHYTTLLFQALSARHDVRFFSLSRQYPRLLFPGTTQIDRSASGPRVPNEPCLDSLDPRTWIGTARRIRRFGAELAVFSWWHPFFAPAFGTVARLCRRRGGVRVCFICHNALPHERSIVDSLLLRYAYAPVDAFVAHSRQDYEDLQRLRPGAVVLQNPHPTYAVFAADDVPSPSEARQRLGLEGRRVLLFFGFVREYKGLHVLLEAMDHLPAEQGYHLLVVGEFYEPRERYGPALARLESRRQVTIVDRYVPNEEIPLYFAASDLAMIPYLTATQSGVVQIAYGFGVPVVATRVGGIPEVVTDGTTGYLVPPGDAAAMAAAVRRHFAEDRRDALRAGIDAENDKYSWDRMVATIEHALERGDG